MTDAELPPSLTRLIFHGPLSEARASRLVARLTRNTPRTVLDIGCGWGELMLRILAAAPGATGFGLDTDESDLARGRDNARARGLAGRVTFVRESGVGTRRGQTASLEEWEDFESGYQCDEEEWLATHGDHPGAAEISERVNQHRSFWLRGYYGLLGQAYLTLAPVG